MLVYNACGPLDVPLKTAQSRIIHVDLVYGSSRYTLACPEIRQSAPISALIKPIGLCGHISGQSSIHSSPKETQL